MSAARNWFNYGKTFFSPDQVNYISQLHINQSFCQFVVQALKVTKCFSILHEHNLQSLKITPTLFAQLKKTKTLTKLSLGYNFVA